LLNYQGREQKLDSYIESIPYARTGEDVLYLIDLRLDTDLTYDELYPEARQFVEEYDRLKKRSRGRKVRLSEVATNLNIRECRAVAFIADTLVYYSRLMADDIFKLAEPLIMKSQVLQAMTDPDVANRFMQAYGRFAAPKSAQMITNINNGVAVSLHDGLPDFADEMEEMRVVGNSSTQHVLPAPSTTLDINALGMGSIAIVDSSRDVQPSSNETQSGSEGGKAAVHAEDVHA
jgi:hypothetical protein